MKSKYASRGWVLCSETFPNGVVEWRLVYKKHLALFLETRRRFQETLRQERTDEDIEKWTVEINRIGWMNTYPEKWIFKWYPSSEYEEY